LYRGEAADGQADIGQLKYNEDASSEILIEKIYEKRLTTRNLIYWSFQIACGMNYLAKNKALK